MTASCNYRPLSTTRGVPNGPQCEETSLFHVDEHTEGYTSGFLQLDSCEGHLAEMLSYHAVLSKKHGHSVTWTVSPL